MKKLALFPFLVMTLVGFSQPGILVRKVDNQGIITHLEFDNTKSFIPLAEAKKLLHDTLKLTTKDDLVLTNEFKDKLGFIRQDYEQHYNGIKVEDGRFGVCARDGKIEYISGEYKKVGDVSIIPSLSENGALKKALDYIKADKYRWEIQSEESRLKIDRKDSSATFYPKGELLICRVLFETNTTYRLAYKYFVCITYGNEVESLPLIIKH